ncbi:MAG: TetR/AcrR family transcriptional regulator [archaeon]|nr:TetR/AcrR family transcriptional regulator [archaeon]
MAKIEDKKVENPVKSRAEQRKEDKSEEIINEAIKLFYKKGIENVPLEEIAKAVKFSRTTLYLYFKNKNDLLLAIGSKGFKFLISTYKKIAEKPENSKGYDKLKCMFTALESINKNKSEISYVFSYVTSLDIYISETQHSVEFNRLSESLRAHMVKYILLGIKDGSIKPDIDPVLTALSIHLTISGLYHQLMVRREDMDKQGLQRYTNEKIRNLVNRTILSSIKQKKN